MKNLILSSVLGLMSFGVFAQSQSKATTEGGPMISIDKEVHDYGTIVQNAEPFCVFTVTNTGDQPLIISKCQGSCGCTVPECTTEPILPGATSAIRVKYDTNRIGAFTKQVTINSNATNNPALQVSIKGVVNAAQGTPSLEKEAAPMAPTESK